MPELAQAFATQLAGIDKINIIEMGNGSSGSGGVNKVMSTVGGGMTAMLAMLKDQFGIDVARLMQAKTDADGAQIGRANATEMAADVVYESSLRWDPARPTTTLITCVDGRWYHHFQEFARVYLSAGTRTDFLAVPGGIEPLTLFDRIPKDFNFFRRRLEGLVAAHGTQRIVAIAHQDCAWYRNLRVGSFASDMRERQISDL